MLGEIATCLAGEVLPDSVLIDGQSYVPVPPPSASFHKITPGSLLWSAR